MLQIKSFPLEGFYCEAATEKPAGLVTEGVQQAVTSTQLYLTCKVQTTRLK